MTGRWADWSARHHGLDPASVPGLRVWLRGVEAMARPLVRLRVRPLAVTVLGVALALGAVVVVGVVPGWAVVLVLGSVLADALDGAVAGLSGTAGPGGAQADAVADRIADCAFAAVVWRCGAPWWLAGAAALVSLVHEAVRAVRGGPARRRITVAERPTRTICTVLAAGSAGVSAAHWPSTVCAAVWVGLGLLGLLQLARSG